KGGSAEGTAEGGDDAGAFTTQKVRPDVTQKGHDMIGDFRTDALHDALGRAPIEDDMLMALLVLAFAAQNVRVDSGADGTFYGGKRFSRHAVSLFDEYGRLAFNQDTLRIAVRSVLIDVLSCRRGMSNSGTVSRIAGVAIGADEYLPNMGSEDFLLCLSRQALEASCAEASVQPRQKVRETRAALVELFQNERFVHTSARFAPPADELLDWIRVSSPTETNGTAQHEYECDHVDDPSEDQDGQIDEAADRGDLQVTDVSNEEEQDDLDQRAAA
ncbi:MAG: plasmid partitioning protein, partial [Pseudomonadota bacterium]|nr:plasmid partitioning protein [Pseudomonadota bacterium]